MRRREALTALLLAPCAGGVRGAERDAAVLPALLRSAGPVARSVLANREFELQVLWTRCRRKADGSWQALTQYAYGLKPRQWFAAASFVKLPLAAVLGEALSQRGLVEQWAELQLRVDGSKACAPLPEGKQWTLQTLLQSMLVVSDNRSYNALYELIGSDALHQRLAQLGYRDSRISARLGCGAALRPGKLAALLLDAQGKRLWDSAAKAIEQTQAFPFGAALKGRAWMEGERQIPGPHDFSTSNYMPLTEVHRMMLELGSGSALHGTRSFALSARMRQILAQTLSLTPRTCPAPRYDWPDDHSKWLLAADSQGHLPASLRIASKNAQSYGFIGDSAFIVEAARDIGFALSAVLFVDRDGVLNDGRYAYEEIGRPFLRELGAAVLAYERSAA